MGTRSEGDSIAQEAFTAARSAFQASRASGSALQAPIDSTTTIEDVQETIQQALSRYKARVDDSGKTRRWLQRSSEVICHYSAILDVFVQHHPEYVSLVWGAMKFLFISALNHGQTLRTLAKSITEVAQRLPSIRKLSTLYPSTEMRAAVEALYSYILEFLQKAHQWLTESRLKHVYHSLTQPPELVYSEILANVTQASAHITELAGVETQMEIRNMYEGQRDNMKQIAWALETSDLARKEEMGLLRLSLERLQAYQLQQGTQLAQMVNMLSATGSNVNDLLVRVESSHTIHTSALLNTNLHLTQLEQLHVLSNMTLSYEDPDKCLQRHAILRRRRARASGDRSATVGIWSSSKLRKSAGATSALITIRGPFSARWTILDFGVDLIQMMFSPGGATILWALAVEAHSGSSSTSWTAVDVLKYLTWQALRVSAATTVDQTGKGTSYTEKDISIRYSRFYTTRTEEDWLNFFTEVISLLGQRRQVLIVIDMAAIQTSWDDDDRRGCKGQNFSLIHGLRRLVKQTTGPRLKVILLVYTPAWSGQISESAAESIVQVKIAKAKPTTINRAKQQSNLRKAFSMRR